VPSVELLYPVEEGDPGLVVEVSERRADQLVDLGAAFYTTDPPQPTWQLRQWERTTNPPPQTPGHPLVYIATDGVTLLVRSADGTTTRLAGGGSDTFAELTDVDLTGLQDGNIFSWDAETATFRPVPAGEGIQGPPGEGIEGAQGPPGPPPYTIIGTYNPDDEYFTGEAVNYGGTLYIATADVPAGEPPPHPSWAASGPMGPPGPTAGVADITEFGAAGNNITDDSDAVQNALNSGLPVVIPVGTFLCQKQLTIPSGTTVRGQGRGSVLRFDWTDADDPKGSTYLVNTNHAGTGDTNITLESFAVHGAGHGAPWGETPVPAATLLMRKVEGVHLRDLYVYRSPGIAIAYQGCRRVRIANCDVFEAGRDAITGWQYTPYALEDVTVTGCTIHTIGDDGIAVHASTESVYAQTTRPRRVTITGNTVHGLSAPHADAAGRGIVVTGLEDFTITGNVVTDTFSNGLHVRRDFWPGSAGLAARRGVVAGNTVTRAGSAGNGTQPMMGIRVFGAEDVQIIGNTVHDSVHEGIYIADAVRCPVRDNLVNGCGTTMVHWGIHVDGSDFPTSSCPVTGNTVNNSASGGIRSYFSPLSPVDGNTCTDNGRAGDGTHGHASGVNIHNSLTGADGRVWASGNYCTDTRPTGKLQTNGVFVGGGPTEITVRNNYLRDNNGPAFEFSYDDPAFVPPYEPYTTPILRRTGNDTHTVAWQNYDVDPSGVQRHSGSGSPELVVPAPVGSTYQRRDGTFAWLYVKTSGSSTAGWVATSQTGHTHT